MRPGEGNESDKVLAIVVTFNGSKWVDRCFGSLSDSSGNIQIVAIDNGSNDDTLQLLRKRHPKVEIIETKENLGFGKANNIGLKKALNADYDYAFLLNQDAWVEKDTITALIETHQKNKDYGLLSPVHFNGEGSLLDYRFANKSIVTNRQLVTDLFLKPNELEPVYDADFVNAACWLLPKNILKMIGGFDPLFTHYGEDRDYCRRVLLHRYKIGVVPRLKIYHDRESRSKDHAPKIDVNWLFIKNLRILKDHKISTPPLRAYIKQIAIDYGDMPFNAEHNLLRMKIKASRMITRIYRQAVRHKENEFNLFPHYLVEQTSNRLVEPTDILKE